MVKSRYGVVILSPNFFKKEWPQRELDGLAQKEIEGKKVILPVWHNVTKKDVKKFSPPLAGKVAAKTSEGIDQVVSNLLEVITPKIDEQKSKQSEKDKLVTFHNEKDKIISFIAGILPNLFAKRKIQKLFGFSNEIKKAEAVRRVLSDADTLEEFKAKLQLLIDLHKTPQPDIVDKHITEYKDEINSFINRISLELTDSLKVKFKNKIKEDTS